MKKKLVIVFAVIAVVLLLIPVRKVYEDGGTQTYTWHLTGEVRRYVCMKK